MLVATSLVCLVLPALLPGSTPLDPAPDRSQVVALPLLNLEGEQTTLTEVVGDAPLVIAYSGVGCPISNKYAARLRRLGETYGSRGVLFVGVNANPQDSRAKIAAECEELGVGFPVLKDFRQELTRTLDAKTTTEVFVFAREGRLVYRGAVDDQHSLGASKPAPTVHWLTDALDALLAGTPVEAERTKAPGCLITRLPQEELPEAITWSRHIAPILRNNCEVCHRPGQIGPFALQTYEQARGWAEMIGSVVQEERMPPWNATHRYDGVFANERSLSKREKAQILKWIADGMPEGDPAEAPAPAVWPEGWRVGEPDAVFAMETYRGEYGEKDEPLPEAGWEVPREGVVDYQYFTARTDFPEDRWIQSIEIRPGAPDVVHHVLIQVLDPVRGFRALDDEAARRSYIAAAVPGDTPSVYPEGYGKRLPKGATLLFQLHYTPNGKQRFDRSRVGIRFCEEVPFFEVVTDAVVNDEFRIPPGAKNFEVRGERVLEEDTGLLGFLPHMHTRGVDFRYVAHHVDGSTEELLATDYDFNWQETYLFRDPLPLPPGTRIECVGHYDNSADNPFNPDPEEWVEWGDQTFEEMFIGYFDYVRPLE